MGGDGAVLAEEIEKADLAGLAGRAVILVEGSSDRRALTTLATRRGRDLDADGISIIATTGATNFVRFVEMLGPAGHDVALAAMCDRAELSEIQAAMSQLDGTRSIYTCVRDLEDELIRAIGPEAMMSLMDEQGDLRRFRSFQNQPDQRHKTIDRQIWRWLGNHKIRYASLMVGILDPARIPMPLQQALDHHQVG